MQNDTLGHRTDDSLLFLVQPGHRFELKFQIFVRASAHAERNRKLADRVQGWLRVATLVTPDLRYVHADHFRESLSRHAVPLAQRDQAFVEVQLRWNPLLHEYQRRGWRSHACLKQLRPRL